MLLQTNSYIVPKDRRAEHARLMRRFRQVLAKLGCDNFEVYEQVGANWAGAGDSNGRYVQIMRFRDRKHQLSVQNAERNDPAAQALIAEFCQLVNFQYQQQQGFFAVGFYNSVLPVAPARSQPNAPQEQMAEDEAAIAGDNDGGVTPAQPIEPAAPIEQVEQSSEAEASSATDEPQQVEGDVVHESSHEVTREYAAEGETIEATIEPPATEAHTAEPHPAEEHSTPQAHSADDLTADGPPLDLNDTATEAPLSEDELLGEISGGEHDADGEIIETGEPVSEGETTNGEHTTPPPPAEEDQPRRSLFRRSRRS